MVPQGARSGLSGAANAIDGDAAQAADPTDRRALVPALAPLHGRIYVGSAKMAAQTWPLTRPSGITPGQRASIGKSSPVTARKS